MNLAISFSSSTMRISGSRSMTDYVTANMREPQASVDGHCFLDDEPVAQHLSGPAPGTRQRVVTPVAALEFAAARNVAGVRSHPLQRCLQRFLHLLRLRFAKHDQVEPGAAAHRARIDDRVANLVTQETDQ